MHTMEVEDNDKRHTVVLHTPGILEEENQAI